MLDKDFFLSIPKAELPSLQAARYTGKIVVVDCAEMVQPAVDLLKKEKEIGFDTETRPAFKKGVSNNMALMQLSTHEVCYLFRLNKIGLPKSVVEILENPDIVKVGTSVHDDFHGLAKLSDCTPRNFVDLQQFVKNFRIHDNSLSRIYAIVFGKRISKNQQKTNWEAEELSTAQKLYASLDAYACVKIYDFLNSGRFNPEESRYVCYPEKESEIPGENPKEE